MKNDIRKLLLEHVTIPEQKRNMFFKTNPGEYAEHDKFLGVTIPNLRKISRNFLHLPLDDIQELLCSPFNEERFLALLILVHKYQKSGSEEQIYQFYLANLQHINNWNLVDSSAHLIIGAHLQNKPRDLLLSLSSSEVLWERRISIVSTWWFIRHNDLPWTLKIAQQLLNDNHDLIHKATGWMLRELGKKDEKQLTNFLEENKTQMPRTMLRYAIEKLTNDRKKDFHLR